MTNTITLSSALQDYLEVILELSEKAEAARVTDIAARLDIAKASVTQAINTLKELNLVTQDKYGPVSLTHKGKELAAKVRHRHRTLRRFLIEVLNVDPQIAEKDACLMEHVISPQTMERLSEFLKTVELKKKDLDSSLPESQHTERKEVKVMRAVKTKALSELQTGEQGKVIRIAAIGPVRRRLLEMGITLGTVLKVRGTAPLGDPIEISVKGYNLSLRKKEAADVFVEVL